jgi:hypothetical protein
MTKLIVSILASATLANFTLCSPSSKSASMNKIADNEAQEGWQLLFNGQSLDGWHSWGTTGTASWKVVDGTIHLDTGAQTQGKEVI